MVNNLLGVIGAPVGLIQHEKVQVVPTVESVGRLKRVNLSRSNCRPLIVALGLVWSTVISSSLLSAFTVDASVPVNTSRNLYVPASVSAAAGAVAPGITTPFFSQALLVKVALETAARVSTVIGLLVSPVELLITGCCDNWRWNCCLHRNSPAVIDRANLQ